MHSIYCLVFVVNKDYVIYEVEAELYIYIYIYIYIYVQREREGGGLNQQSLPFHAQVTLASLGCCHKSGAYAKSCARRSVCFSNRGCQCANNRLPR
jgi:hypothetical protein